MYKTTEKHIQKAGKPNGTKREKEREHQHEKHQSKAQKNHQTKGNSTPQKAIQVAKRRF